MEFIKSDSTGTSRTSCGCSSGCQSGCTGSQSATSDNNSSSKVYGSSKRTTSN